MPTLLLALVGPALAADCPRTWTPDALHDELLALREAVAFAEPGVDKRLDDLDDALTRCLNGPVYPEDLAALYLARAAHTVLTSGEADAVARQRMIWAKAAGGVWDPTYGPDVGAVFRSVDATGKGAIQVEMHPGYAFVDGRIVYTEGPHPVPAGRHFVQWDDPVKGWVGEWLEVSNGETASAGAPLTPEDELEPWVPPVMSGGSPPEETRAVASAGDGLGLTARVGTGARRIGVLQELDGVQGIEGHISRPVLRVDARYSRAAWWGGVDLTLTPAADSVGFAWPRAFAVAGGVTLPVPVDLRVGLGAVVGSLPSLTAAAPDVAPDFDSRTSVGLRLLGAVDAGETLGGGADLRAEWLGGSLTAELTPRARYTLGRWSPELRVPLGAMILLGAPGGRYRWAGLEVGVSCAL